MSYPMAARILGALLFTTALVAAGPEAEALEREALAAKSRGRYLEAQQLTGRALTALLGPEWRREDAVLGRTHHLLHLYYHLARRTGDTRRALAFLEGLGREHSLAEKAPGLADCADLLTLRLLLLTLQKERQQQLTGKLGFIRRWQVIGPFDNERGQGVEIAYPPEKKIDLRAEYRGKRGRVEWREADFTTRGGGMVNLGALLRPKEQVLAYAATSITLPAPADLLLKAGSAGALKIWINGKLVLASDVRRPFHYDQDRVTIRLHKGPNLVLVKCGTQEGPFCFALRLCSPDGSPFPGLAGKTFPRLLQAAAEPADPPTSSSPPGPLQLLESLHRKTGAAEWAYRRAFLLHCFQPFDESLRLDKEWAAKAVAGDPRNPHYRFLLARTLAKRRGIAAEKDENPRRRALEECLRLDPEYAEAEATLGLYYFRGQDNLVRGLARVERALKINPDYITAGMMKAEILEILDGEAHACRLRERLFTTPAGALRPELAREIAQLAGLRGRPEKEAAIYTELLERNATTALAAVAARRLIRVGRRDQALALLHRAKEVFPFSHALPSAIAELHTAQERYDRAATALRGILEFCPRDDLTLVKLGELAGEAGNQEGMISWFQQALACNPGLDKVRRRLEFLKQGEKPFYAELALDTRDLLAQPPPIPAAAKKRNDSHDYLLTQKVIEVDQDGTSHIYEHLVARILTEAGARKFQRFSRAYFGGEQSGRILEARVIHPDGSVSRARINNSFMPFLGSIGRIMVRMPAIRPGDVVDISFRIDELEPSFFGTYFGHRHIFAADDAAAVHRARLDLITPAERKISYNSKNGVPEPRVVRREDGKILRSWEMEKVEPVQRESRMPAGHEICPTVEISTYGSWQEFGRWWWSMIRRQYDSSPEMKAKVTELTAGKESTTEKIRAIYDFVVTEVRYVAWEFGVHGYKPYTASTIFSRRHGDCKDKAILLGAMLREVGIDAWPVLIKADDSRSLDDLTVVLVDHFNHCIAYVPPAGDWKGGFLDGTAQYHPLVTVPNMDRGARVVTFRQGEPEIMQVPWSDPQDNLDRRIYEVRLSPTGDARVVFTGRPTGSQAVGIRAEYGNEPGKRREKLEEEFAARLGKVKVEAMEFSDLMDLGEPVVYRVEMAVREFAEKRRDKLVLRPCFETANWIQQAPMEKRIHDLLLINPWLEHYTIEYLLPPGWEPESLPPDRKAANDAGFYQVTWRREGQRLTADVRRALTRQRIPADEFQAFRELAGSLDNAETQVVLVGPAGRGGEK